jgi:hypothetical protein
MMTEFKREVHFYPAFGDTDPVKRREEGIGGVKIRFVLVGPLGAIHFAISTNWDPAHIQEERWEKGRSRYFSLTPDGSDISYHSPVPMYEGQASHENCEWLGGRTCYSDGSGLVADRIRDVLLAEGDAGVWREMEGWYHSRLEGTVVWQ